MTLRSALPLLFCALALLACADGGKDAPRPTQIVVITSEPSIADLQATISVLETRQALLLPTAGAPLVLTSTPTLFSASPTLPASPLPTILAATPTPPTPTITPLPSVTPSPSPTALPAGFPTPELFSLVVVEQIFEGGRMLWLQPLRQIWVLVGENIDPRAGTWRCYQDTYLEGQPERDPAFDPPPGTVSPSQFAGAVPQQPIRGFGKLWREQESLRRALGWALTAETMHTTRYQYNAGGNLQSGRFVRTGGEIRLDSLYQQTLILQEETPRASCEQLGGTWRVN